MTKRIIVVALAVLILSASLILSIDAVPKQENRLYFSTDWISNDNSVEMNKRTDPERKEVYTIEVTDYHSPAWRGLMQNFTEPVDLFYYRTFFFDCYADSLGEEAEYFARVLFWDESQQYEYKVQIEAGEWETVSIDISELACRERVNGIEVSIFAESSEADLTVEKMSFGNIYVGDMMDKDMIDAYMCEDFSVYGGLIAEYGRDNITVEIVAREPALTSDIHVRDISKKNAIRYVIDNRSNAKKFTLLYSESSELSGARRVSLEASEGYGVYIFELDEGVFPKRAQLVFEGADRGDVSIFSASMVSVYKSDIIKRGEVSLVEIDRDADALIVKGNVEYNTAVGFSDYRLALYRLDIWEDESDIKDKEPVTTVAMSSRFEFYIKMSELPLATEKYVVALISGQDSASAIPIDSAKYISNPEVFSAVGKRNEPNTIKGFATYDARSAKSLGAGHVVLDVYLDKMLNEKNTGYLHTLSGAYYYYNMDEVNRLDGVVKQYTDVGISVYLRLLVSDGDRLRAIRATTPETARRTEATVDFLSSRYNGSKGSRIAGFIIGKNTDLEKNFNYMGELSLDEYVGELARVIRLVGSTARMNDPSMTVALSMSDSFFSERYTEAELQGKAYDKKLFIEGLSHALSDGGDMDWLIAWENSGFFFEPNTKERISASNFYVLSDLIDEYSERYTAAPVGVIYNFTPSDENMKDLGAIYAYSYYTFIFDDLVRAFITTIDIPSLSDNDAKIIRYIDTTDSALYTEGLYSYFGAHGWGEIIAGNTLHTTKVVKLIETPLSCEIPFDLVGKISLWNFSGAYSPLGWQKGASCEFLAMGERDGNVALDAKMSERGSIIYVYDEPVTADMLTHLSFDIDIPKESESVSVKLTVGGAGFRIESKGEVEPNTRTVLFADLGEIPTGAELEYIELQADAAEIFIYGIDGHSNEYGDVELENHYYPAPTADERVYNPIWTVLVATVFLASVAAAVMIFKNEKSKE